MSQAMASVQGAAAALQALPTASLGQTRNLAAGSTSRSSLTPRNLTTAYDTWANTALAAKESHLLHSARRQRAAAARGVITMSSVVEGETAVEEATIPQTETPAETAPPPAPAAEAGNQAARNRTVRPAGRQPRPRRTVTLRMEDIAVDTTYPGKVMSIQSYGAFVDIGSSADGLVHISELSNGFVKNVEEVVQVGQEVQVRVLDIDVAQNRIKLSMRDREAEQAAQAERPPRSDRPRRTEGEAGDRQGGERRRVATLRSSGGAGKPSVQGKYKKGQTVTGTVKNLVPFGAFIELEAGVEGLCHISEIGENSGGSKIEELVTVGQQVTCRVISFERSKNGERISLTMREQVDVNSLNSQMSSDEDNVIYTNPFQAAFRKSNLIIDSLPGAAELKSASQSEEKDDTDEILLVKDSGEAETVTEEVLEEVEEESEADIHARQQAEADQRAAAKAAAEAAAKAEEEAAHARAQRDAEYTKAQEEIKAKEEAEAKVREAEAKAKHEAEAKAQEEAEAKAKQQEAKAKKETEAKAKQEAEAKATAEEDKPKESAKADEPAAAPAAAGGISAAVVKQLRDETGSGMMDCKKALGEAEGDLEKAREILRKKGLASADKKQSRVASEGSVASYIHDGRIGVLIELNCETDFVSRGEKFKELLEDMAMQVAACPQVQFVSTEEVPSDVIAKEREIEMGKEDLASKPEAIRSKIVDGRISKRLNELALLEQPYIRDETGKQLVKDVIKAATATVGEKISIRRFSRFNLGEGIEKKVSNLAEEVAAQTKVKEPKPEAPKAAEAAPAPAEEKKPAVAVSAATVKALREETGAGMMDCKKALAECENDVDKAREFLRKKGLASADKKASRVAAEGAIGSYIHDGRIGVLVELNCETDFVARGETFKDLLEDIAMQIAACPAVEFVSPEDVDPVLIAKEREIELGKDDLASKPEAIREKIVDGRISKRVNELALLEQPYIRDDKVKVKDLIKQTIASVGENIQIRRFLRFNLGEGLEKKSSDFAAEVAAATAVKA